MLRYKLRTLLIVLALGPPLLAGAWSASLAWRAHWEEERQRQKQEDELAAIFASGPSSRAESGLIRDLLSPAEINALKDAMERGTPLPDRIAESQETATDDGKR